MILDLLNSTLVLEHIKADSMPFPTFSAMLYRTSSIFMHVGSQSCPKRMTRTRSSSDRMAWSTCQPLWRCGSMYDILAVECPLPSWNTGVSIKRHLHIDIIFHPAPLYTAGRTTNTLALANANVKR